ncbi:MAG: protein GlmU [Desulfamplus sp.]|nr:protein GlmU [Desulfamplus sp.]
MDLKTRLNHLMEKGVEMPLPESVFIDENVDMERISGDNVTFYPGTRLSGSYTLIMNGVKLGFEAPVTLDNVHVGPDTELKGGFFQQCAFAGRNIFGSGAHVRAGTILEEEASAGHTVGLKQTILFPFVTLGSLVNFCDCLMAGGTSRKDHSEVGSSYIHFNYTPNQDKATPSMLGNVHGGIMLNQRPVFLGGQGGLVGPCRLPFGTVTAAGTIWRKDVEEENRLLCGGSMKEISISWTDGIYTSPQRIFRNNCRYIASLTALMQWYRHIRPMFAVTLFEQQMLQGMTAVLAMAVDERIVRLGEFVSRLEASREKLVTEGRGQEDSRSNALQVHDHIIEHWPYVEDIMRTGYPADTAFHEDSLLDFCGALEQGIKEHGNDYISVIKGLEPTMALAGSRWLESIEEEMYSEMFSEMLNNLD